MCKEVSPTSSNLLSTWPHSPINLPASLSELPDPALLIHQDSEKCQYIPWEPELLPVSSHLPFPQEACPMTRSSFDHLILHFSVKTNLSDAPLHQGYYFPLQKV